MAKNYTSAYEGIKDQATKLGTALPTYINPNGVALLDYLKELKARKSALPEKKYQSLEQKAEEMMISRAVSDTEAFYTDVVGDAPDYGEG